MHLIVSIFNNNKIIKIIIYSWLKFVAHPHCQQLLVKLWYEGISGFRRRSIFVKFFGILALATLFPFLSIIYILFPASKCGQILNQPFIKFVCHSASYIIFLSRLIFLKEKKLNFRFIYYLNLKVYYL